MPRQIHAPVRLLVTAMLLAALFHAHSVRAETRISGEPDAVRVEVRDARVDEVIDALGTSFGLQYRNPVSLGRRVTGTYEGTLQRVVARLLDGYDFVIKSGAEGVEVRVYGAVKPGQAALTPKPAAAAKPRPAVKARHEARRKRRAR